LQAKQKISATGSLSFGSVYQAKGIYSEFDKRNRL
jgi:hypothetical protein